ncbi:MAG: dual specificity protein phosphatase family protein [Candidatus Sulfotelmatobacter sp.]
MRAELYWLDGPWPGRLAVAARPRGGDWLGDDVAAWKRAGVDVVFSLLTPQEETDLDLSSEAREFLALGMQFVAFPISDRQVPGSEAKLAAVLEKLDASLSAGKNAVVHCRQGIGRSGLVAACLLITKGLSPGAAIENVSAARGVTVPETAEQRDWIDRYAAALATRNS